MSNNFKVSYTGDRVEVKAKLSKQQIINKWEADFIHKKTLRGLMSVSNVEEGKGEITYVAPSAISIDKFLANVITANQLLMIIIQTVELYKKIKSNKLYMSNLVLDKQYIVVNTVTSETYFIYLPISSTDTYVNLIEFIKSLIFASKFYMNDKDLQKVVSFISYIGNAGEFDATETENILKNICPELYSQISSSKTNASGFITNDKLEYVNHYDSKPKLNEFKNNNSVAAFSNNYDDSNTTLLDDDTSTQLLEDEYATTVLDEKVPQPYMIRLKNNEKIIIDKAIFKIGKDKVNMDYVVTDNSAVSRNHAQIVTKNGRYFIVDNNSTNKTYVDNEAIVRETEVELKPESVIKLGNEEFQFNVE